MPKMNKVGLMQYEESMPLARLVDYLTANHYAAVISPEHDADVWTSEECKNWRKSQESLHSVYIREDATTYEYPTGELRKNELGAMVPVTETRKVPQVGEKKKPHRHVYLEKDYSAPLATWLNELVPLGVSYLEPIKNKRAYLRYLCHLDNPEKARYDVKDVIMLGGVDVTCIYDKTQRDADNLEFRILDFIVKHKVTNVTRLQQLLLHKAHDIEAYREVKAHYGYWAQYLRNCIFKAEIRLDDSPKLLGVDSDGVVQDVA